MRQVKIHLYDQWVGTLSELPSDNYEFAYLAGYAGEPISNTLPLKDEPYVFDHFPAFFDGLLPEGFQLQGLLRIRKIDHSDYLSQLIATGADMVGAVTVSEMS